MKKNVKVENIFNTITRLKNETYSLINDPQEKFTSKEMDKLFTVFKNLEKNRSTLLALDPTLSHLSTDPISDDIVEEQESPLHLNEG